MWREKRMGLLSKQKKMILFATICLGTGLTRLYAQDGVAGIQEANTKVRGYFDVGCNLMYAVGAILGLIGAVKVYQKWSNGHPDTGATAAAWFGSCVFLVVVATVLKSFFGL
jgi:hypothetical protein